MCGVSKLKRSTKAHLGGLSLLDLLWRVPEATPGDGTVADVVLVALSVITGELRFLEAATAWVLIGYASFTLAPKAYPGRNFPRQNRGFRVRFTLVTIVVAVILPMQAGGTAVALTHIEGVPSTSLTFSLVLLTLEGLGGLFAMYLYRLGWRMDPEDDRTVGTFTQLSFLSEKEGRDEAKQWTAPGWRGSLSRGIAWAVLGTVAALPGFFAGFVVNIILISSPTGELLFLSAVVVSAVLPRLRRNSEYSPAAVFDLETYLYDSISDAIRGRRGKILLMCVFGTLLLSIGLFALASSSWVNITGSIVRLFTNRDRVLISDPELYVLTSAGIGAVSLVLAGTAYATWATVRELRRVAAFVDVQQGEPPHAVPPRTVGFVLPGLITFPIFSLVIRSLVTAGKVGDVGSVELLLFATTWPLLLVGLAMCWWWTRTRGSTPVTNEDHVIIGSTALLPALSAVSSAEIAIVDTLGLTTAIVGVGYLPYARKYSNQHREKKFRQHSLKLYYVLLGIIPWITAQIVDGSWIRYLRGFAGVVIILNVAWITISAIDVSGRKGSDSSNQSE